MTGVQTCALPIFDLQRVAVEVDVFGAELLSGRHDECEVGGHCVVRLLAGVDEPAVRGRRGDTVASVEVGPGDRREVRSRTVEEEEQRVRAAQDDAPITRKFGRSGSRSGTSDVRSAEGGGGHEGGSPWRNGCVGSY